mgnify:CR=1 FL=1
MSVAKIQINLTKRLFRLIESLQYDIGSSEKKVNKFSYDIEKIIDNNNLSLLFVDKYLIDSDMEKINCVKTKYKKFIMNIFNPFGLMNRISELWDFDEYSDLLEIINKDEYSYISPLFIVEKYLEIRRNTEMYEETIELLKTELNTIDELRKEVQINYRLNITKIKSEFILLVDDSLHPDQRYFGYVNSLIMESAKFLDSCIDINCHCAPALIKSIFKSVLEMKIDELCSNDDNKII